MLGCMYNNEHCIHDSIKENAVSGVLVVEQNIIKRFFDRKFFSVNAATALFWL